MLKLLVELGPIIVFFITYQYSDILLATKLMLLVTSICLLISYLVDKKISLPLLLSAIILFFSGAVTLMTGDSKYIKMKPTIVYIIFCVSLYVASLRNIALIKNLLGHVINLKDQDWLNLSRRCAGFFFGMAVVNELIWRNFSDSFWVSFKVFGAGPVTLLFIALQIPFILKKQIPPK